MKIGEALREARIKAGLSQAKLAKMAHLGESTVSMYENGRVFPGDKTILALCMALGITPEELLKDVEPETRPFKRFGLVLRKARTVKGLTQEELAEKSGLPVSAIAFYERGQREPGITTIEMLSKGLGIKPIKLMAVVWKE